MLVIVLAAVLMCLFPNKADSRELRSQAPFENSAGIVQPGHKLENGGRLAPGASERVKELPRKQGLLTLQQCIAEAVGRSPALAAVRHDIEAAKYDIAKKRGTTLPFLSADIAGYEVNGASVTPLAALNIFEPQDPNRFNRQAHWGPVATQSISLSYPLLQYGSFLGLNNPPVVAAAKAVYQQQKGKSLIAEQQIVFDVITAFSSEVWYASEVDMDQALVNLLRKRFEIVSEEVALGLKLPQDAELARVQLEGSRQRLTSSTENAREWKFQLAALVGRADGDGLELDPSQPSTPQLPPLKQFLSQVLSTHPALSVQGSKVEVARQQYRVDRSTLLPTANLDTSFTGAQNLDFFNGSRGQRRPTLFLSYLQIRMPIFDFGQRRAAIRESEEQVQSEQARLEEVELDLRKAITQTYSEIYDVDRTLVVLQSAYTSASNRVELVRAQRREGLVDELTSVDAESALLNARVSLESEKLVKRLKYAEIQNLAGGAWHWVQ
jgi:outer membrane protein TolC